MPPYWYHQFDDNFAMHLKMSALVWYAKIIVPYCNTYKKKFWTFYITAIAGLISGKPPDSSMNLFKVQRELSSYFGFSALH